MALNGELRAERQAPSPPVESAPPPLPPPERPTPSRGRFSPLTRRILTVNVFALAILVAGLLYLGQYQENLIQAELQALGTQGEIFAGALGQGARGVGAGGESSLRPEIAAPMLRRLVLPTRTRARLFVTSGEIIADSRVLLGPGGAVRIETLPPPEEDGMLTGLLFGLYDSVASWLPGGGKWTAYSELPVQRADNYEEVVKALSGEPATRVRASAGGGLVLSAAAPVQHFKHILGALMLTRSGADIEHSVREVRLGILKVFLVALAVTVLLSFYLAGTIVRPLRRLAEGAERVRKAHGREHGIPDFRHREDEIGDLSGALRDMTDALWQRLDAIDSFAADVAHEIKNPLTSLRSAVETTARISDPDQQRRLMDIILEDVQRLDRLISDISDASRLDAELFRAARESLDVGQLLSALVQVHDTAAVPGRPTMAWHAPNDDALLVQGDEGRLAQVFQNLLANAFSFSHEGGKVILSARRVGGHIEVTVEDEGPGIPDGSFESIFDRFYSERPEGERFGTHSGLGLSISRQIVEAHGGAITAGNRRGPAGSVAGACFTVRLPAA
ncbi:MAG: stimulus-sensing domain-containing protein [Alphaproteobacteria bacterium]